MGLVHPPNISPQDWCDASVFTTICFYFVNLRRAGSHSRADSCFLIVNVESILLFYQLTRLFHIPWNLGTVYPDFGCVINALLDSFTKITGFHAVSHHHTTPRVSG